MDVEAYTHRTRTVVALERAANLGLPMSPGEDVRYVVADDDCASIDRVRLSTEIDATTEYDESFY